MFFQVGADEDTVRWWRLHRMDFKSVGGDRYMVRFQRPCYFYDPDTGNCKDYDNRPDICKRFLCELALGG